MHTRLKARVAALVVLVLGITGTAFVGSALAQEGSGAWHARIYLAGRFEGVVAAVGNLYAVRYPDGNQNLSNVVRIDPINGRVVASSQSLPDAQLPVTSGDEMWVSGLTPKRRGAVQRAVLTELHPTTLTRVRQVSYPGDRQPSLIEGSSHLVALQVGQASGCLLRWISPVSGRITRSRALGRSIGQCAGATIDSSGLYLYVIVDGPVSRVTLIKANASTGQVVATVHLPAVSQFFSMTATSTRLWISGGSPGTNGALLYLASSPMRLLAQSDAVNGARQTLPTFGQFPQVELSGGRVWVASDGPLGCLRHRAAAPWPS